MNREIKFRAWILKDGKMIQHRNRAPAVKMFTPDYAYTNKEVAVMQYTGLKDKSGVEIYHADLCLYDRNINGKKNKEVFVVEYQDGAFFIESNTERVHLHSIPETQESIEVIGNIHEHPHLIEE